MLERAKRHNEEQQGTGKRQLAAQEYRKGNLQCLLSVHVDDINGTAPKEIADSLLKYLNDKVGRCKADCTSFLHTGIQHESAPGSVFTHQYVYIDSIKPIDADTLTSKDEDSICDIAAHDAYRSVLGAVAWIVLTRAEVAVYVQVLQRRAHVPRVKDCKRLNVVIRYMKRHKCGLKSVALQHPLKFVAFTGAAFKAQPEESTGLALRGLAAVLAEDDGKDKPSVINDLANFVDFTARRRRRAARSTFSSELNGLVDSVEQVLLRQCTLHQIYCGTSQTPEHIIDLLECGKLYLSVDCCVVARAVYDAISASDACGLVESSLKLHIISVRDRMACGLIRKFFWVETRDMLAHGLAKRGNDRALPHSCSNDCKYVSKHEPLVHLKIFGSATNNSKESLKEEGHLDDDQ